MIRTRMRHRQERRMSGRSRLDRASSDICGWNLCCGGCLLLRSCLYCPSGSLLPAGLSFVAGMIGRWPWLQRSVSFCGLGRFLNAGLTGDEHEACNEFLKE